MLIWLPAIAVFIVGGLWLAQRRLTYLPSQTVPPVAVCAPRVV